MNIEINGLNINYVDKGNGPVVVLLHGWGSSLGAFTQIINSLCESHRMIAVDLPGFGESDCLPGAWDVSDYIEFVRSFLEKLNITDAVFAGHSFGGRIIIKGVGSGILSASKIVLIDSAGIKPKKSFKSKIRQAAYKTAKFFITIPLWKAHTEGALDRLRSKFGSADYKNASPVLRQTLVKAVNEDLKQYLPDIKVPSLLIWGDNDTATPLSDARIMEKLIPDSGVCVIKGAGHFSFIERPYEVIAILKSFLGG